MSDDKRVPAYSWYALGVLFVVYLVNFVDRQILSILANDIKADLHIGDAQLGFLYGTAFAIFYALFGIPLGRLADGWNRTRLLALGMALWSAMTMASGFARGFGSLAAARVGVGVGEATAAPCAYSLISDWFPRRMRATALGIYSAGLFTGSGLSLLFGGAIVQAWNAAYPAGGPLGLVGWQAAFVGVGLPGLLIAVWVLSLREPARGLHEGLASEGDPHAWRRFALQVSQIIPPLTLVAAARQGARVLALNIAVAAAVAALAWALGKATGNYAQFAFIGVAAYAVFTWATGLKRDDPATFRLTWRTRTFMAIVAAYAAVCVLGYTVSYWAAPYAERTFGLSKIELGQVIGVPAAVGGFLGVILGGWLADRLQRRWVSGRLWVVAIALLAPVPLMLVGYTTDSAATFVVCSFLLQVVTSSALGASASASLALVLPRMRGTATAVFLLGAALIGLGLGPFFAGFVSELTGSLGRGVMTNLAIVPPGLAALALAIASYSRALETSVDRAVAEGEVLIPA
jgi:MFS family permease